VPAAVHEVAVHTQTCVVVLQVGVVGLVQSAFELHWPQVALAALTHTGVAPLQHALPHETPVQLTHVEPLQVSVAFGQHTALPPLPQVFMLAQPQVPATALVQLGAALPERQQVVPHAVPAQVAQLVPLQYCPAPHELDEHTQVCVVVLQVGVVPEQFALVLHWPQMPGLTHTGVAPLQHTLPHDAPAQVTQVEPLQVSLAFAQQVVLAPLPQVLPLVQPQVLVPVQLGVAPVQHLVPQAAPAHAAHTVPLQ
jgi:hypothetical protein